MSPSSRCIVLGVSLIVSIAQAAAPPSLEEPALVHPVLLHAGDAWQLFARCPTRKVLPGEPLIESTDLVRRPGIALAAARNESEQVSLVIRPAAELSGVSVSFGPLEGPQSISEAAWSWQRVVNVPVDKATSWYGTGGWQTGRIPDPLAPGEPFSAPAGENTTLLLTVRTPVDAAPGVYRGTIRVEAPGTAQAAIPVELTVWDIALPATRTMDTMACGVGVDDPELCRFLADSGVTSLKY
ncbi:MAG: hypothetical protein JXR94_04630, partial [Candidatus Hydrogenedentes bacterium]|nr:hypothetical protein [Candidatus Hydrogenedentota bacterium]